MFCELINIERIQPGTQSTNHIPVFIQGFTKFMLHEQIFFLNNIWNLSKCSLFLIVHVY
jgi:hypothetical protein